MDMTGGLTDYGEAQALIALLPNGTARYVGLFTTLPDDDGTGGTEASGGGYARASHSSWVNATSGTATERRNDGAITLPELSADLEGNIGWGVWDDPSAGNLIAAGPLVDGAGNAVTVAFSSGDTPRFADQELKVGID